MKILRCNRCQRQQKEGKYCLDCGGQLSEIITSEVKFKPIETSRTADQLKSDVRNWLGRIGVQQTDIKINTANTQARIEYTLNKSLYCFSSTMQGNITNNLAAVEQFLHYRVLGIERGIESVEKAFAGYEALPDYSSNKIDDPYLFFGFKTKVSIEDVRTAYKIMVKKYHPDTNPNASTQNLFLLAQKAMEMIEKENMQ